MVRELGRNTGLPVAVSNLQYRVKTMKHIFLFLLLSLPIAAQSPQSRQSQTPPAQAQESPSQRPPSQQSQGRQRNTDAARPPNLSGGAVAEKIDETPAVTRHEININGKTLKYTATVAQMPIKAPTGETEAHIFYMAYTLDGVTDPASRPLTFAFNGGPGSASIWVHMGAMGPRKAKLLDNGDMPPPPFKLVDNEYTWLDQTDLVFIDPVGTGYSRAKTADIARRLNGVQGDLQSVGEFMRMYVHRNNRWASPLYIAGESYGTFRAAGLAGYLIDQGIAFNGIVLISTVLNFATIRPGLHNSLAYALHLPTYTADAWYHKKLPADLQKDLKATLKEVEQWAMTGYREALDKVDPLTPGERKAVIEKLARYTGLEPRYIDNSDLRFDVAHFTRELLRDRRLTIGRLDGRLTGPSPLNAGETAEFDPSGTLPRPPYQAAFLNYIQNELGYKTDMIYNVSGGIMPWDWGVQNGYVETGNLLRNAFAKNPHLKVLVCQGYYDLATPYFAAKYTMNHLGIHPDVHKNITWEFYQSGHMMYIDKESAAKLKQDITEFLNKASPQP
jgi:carboxypeptidase C (cathepsin A)